jgi:hypothetical protein
MHYYTYAYLREDKTPYYIGKGKGDRINSKQRSIKPPKDKSRILLLKQNLTEAEAFKHEIYMIFLYGRKDLGTGILYNMTNGGEGSSGWVPSEESRKKMSQSSKGKTHSEESKIKMSEAHKGNTYCLGKTLSEKHKKNLSEANKGEKNSFYGKTHSEESRKKISDIHKGKTVSEETRRKIGEESKGNTNWLGKTHSEETRKKISEAGKGRKWWNDGCGNIKFVVECPGNDWKPGRK